MLFSSVTLARGINMNKFVYFFEDKIYTGKDHANQMRYIK